MLDRVGRQHHRAGLVEHKSCKRSILEKPLPSADWRGEFGEPLLRCVEERARYDCLVFSGI